MGELGINDVTHGYSKTGAEEFKQILYTEAIVKTAEILRDTNEITNTFRQGWAGTAETNFENQLHQSVETVASGLEEIKKALESELSQIESNMAEFDNNLVDSL